jgi:hypothetical protein
VASSGAGLGLGASSHARSMATVDQRALGWRGSARMEYDARRLSA